VLGSGAELAKQQRELEQFRGALVSARSSEGAQSMVAQVRLQNLHEREQGLSVQMRAHTYACECSVCTVRRRPPATRHAPTCTVCACGVFARRQGGGRSSHAGGARQKRADEARLREAKETLEQQRYLNSLTACVPAPCGPRRRPRQPRGAWRVTRAEGGAQGDVCGADGCGAAGGAGRGGTPPQRGAGWGGPRHPAAAAAHALQVPVRVGRAGE